MTKLSRRRSGSRRRGRRQPRGQGPVRHGRHPHDYGSILFDEHVPPSTAERGAAARGGRLRERRQGEPARVRLRRHLARTSTTGRCRTRSRPGGSRAARAAARRPRSRRGSSTRRSAATPAARSGSRRRAAARRAQADVGARPARRLLPARAELRQRRADGARRRRLRARCWRRSCRASRARAPPRSADLRVGVAWLEHADPLVRARVEAAAALFPRAEPVDLPLDCETLAALPARGRRGAPRALRREPRGVRRRRRAQDRALPRGRPTARPSRPAAARERYRASAARALEGFDLLVTPTLPCVAPPAPTRRGRARAPADPLHVPVQRARLAGARAALRPGRGRAARVGAARRAAPGDDALRARGRALERSLKALSRAADTGCGMLRVARRRRPLLVARPRAAPPARRPTRAGRTAEPARLPAARGRARRRTFPRTPVVRWQAGPRARRVRVRARDEPELRRLADPLPARRRSRSRPSPSRCSCPG